jgi:hypothetical protein
MDNSSSVPQCHGSLFTSVRATFLTSHPIARIVSTPPSQQIDQAHSSGIKHYCALSPSSVVVYTLNVVLRSSNNLGKVCRMTACISGQHPGLLSVPACTLSP